VFLWNKSVELLGSDKAAREWLMFPELSLRGRRPIDLMINNVGFCEIEDLIGQIAHGIIS